MSIWIDKIYKPFEKIVSIDVQCISDESYLFHYCIVQNKNGQLTIIEQNENLNTIDELIKKYKDLPICINISGQGILLKENLHAFNQLNEVYSILPNIDSKLYYWHHENFGNKSYTTIAKATTVEKIKTLFNSLHIISVTLGPISTLYIKEFIDLKNQINITNYSLKEIEGNISFSEGLSSISDEAIFIGKDKVLNNVLISFSTIVKFLSEKEETFSTKEKESLKEYKYNNIFKKSLIGVLVFTLSTLLINAILFMYSTKKVEDLQAQSGSLQEKLIVDSLQQLLSNQGEYMKKAGWSESSKTSFYADRIASTINDEQIHLTELNIYPIIENEEDTLKFRYNKIVINGISKNAFDVNEWKKKLENEKWLQKVILNDFTFTNDNNYANFSLELDI